MIPYFAFAPNKYQYLVLCKLIISVSSYSKLLLFTKDYY